MEFYKRSGWQCPPVIEAVIEAGLDPKTLLFEEEATAAVAGQNGGK